MKCLRWRRLSFLKFIFACWLIVSIDKFLLSPRRSSYEGVAVKPPPYVADSDETSPNTSTVALPLFNYSTPSEGFDGRKPLENASQSQYLVTAILPVDEQSLTSLKTRTATLLDPQLQLHEVLLLCRPEHHSAIRDIIVEVLSEDNNFHNTDVSIFSWPPQMEEGTAILYAAQHIEPPFDRVLLLDRDGLDPWDLETREMLAGRFATVLPVGPRGFGLQDDRPTCLIADATPNIASFLVPPFSIAPLLVPSHDLPSDAVFDIWPSLGHHISRARFEGVGGVIIDYNKLPSWCSDGNDPSESDIVTTSKNGVGTFAIILPSLSDLFSLAALVCHLWADGYNIGILLTEEDASIAPSVGNSIQLSPSCALKANVLSELRLSDPLATPGSWLADLPSIPNIVISVPTTELFLNEVLEELTVIRIPHEDLPFADWMATLPLEAWQSKWIRLIIFSYSVY